MIIYFSICSIWTSCCCARRARTFAARRRSSAGSSRQCFVRFVHSLLQSRRFVQRCTGPKLPVSSSATDELCVYCSIARAHHDSRIDLYEANREPFWCLSVSVIAISAIRDEHREIGLICIGIMHTYLVYCT